MKISKEYSASGLKNHKSEKTITQNLSKETIQIETSSQKALEQIGRAQIGINFKGNEKEIPEPIPLEAKLKIIENLNLEKDNADFLLTLTDEKFFKYIKIIAENSPEKCLEQYKNNEITKNEYEKFLEFFKTRKFSQRPKFFPNYPNIDLNKILSNKTIQEKFDDFCKRGLCPKEALLLSFFDYDSEVQMDRAVELVKRNVYVYGAQIHCRSKESYDKKIENIKNLNGELWKLNDDYNIINDKLIRICCDFQNAGIDLKYVPECAMDKKSFFKFIGNGDDYISEKKILNKYLKQGDLTYQEAREKSSQEALNEFIELGKQYNIEEENIIGMHKNLSGGCLDFFENEAGFIFDILKQGADLSYAIVMAQYHYTALTGYKYEAYKTNFEKLIKNGMNPKVAQIVATREIEDPEKIKLIEKLVDKKFIEDIKKRVNNPNLDKHIDNIFNIRKIEDPLDSSTPADSNLSYEEIVDGAAKLMKSPIKLALKRPQQYLSDIPLEHTIKINGKYPSLNKEQEEKYIKKVETFFQKTSKYTLRAIKYLDSDTFNQLMDKRFNIFEEELKEIDKLTDKSYQLVSELLNKRTKDNKILPAKEKIELVKIILHLQNAKMLDSFDFFDENGYLISNQELHNKLLNKIFEILGLKEDEISNIPKEKMNFDNTYIYTLLSTTASGSFPEFERDVIKYAKEHPEYLKATIERLEKLYDDEEALEHEGATRKQCEASLKLFKNINFLSEKEIFKLYTVIFNEERSEDRTAEIIRAALFEDFADYILDESNEFGQTNTKTKEKFELSGIDYSTWLNYDNAESINLNNHNFTIQLWDRNPQKDLFIGNRTSCCTGIGEANGQSTSIYLANTAFNVIQLKDESNNTIAMSRIFMGNINSKPSLILDNIEVNNTFLKNLDEKQQIKLRNKIFEYAKNFTKSLSNEDIPIYFSTSYTKLPVDDLETTEAHIGFIGDCTNSFYNNTKKGWTKAENLIEEKHEIFVL